VRKAIRMAAEVVVTSAGLYRELAQSALRILPRWR
jgi:hypothetical protein